MDLQEILQEKYNRFIDIKNINYLPQLKSYEVLVEDKGNLHLLRISEDGQEIKNADNISVWIFEVGPGELVTNTTNNFRQTDKVKSSIFLSKRNINTLNSIVKENSIDLTPYLTNALKPFILSCKSVGAEAVPSFKENKYFAYLIWEIEVSNDRDIDDLTLENMLCSFISNTLWSQLDNCLAEIPIRSAARRSSKHYKRREDGIGYEADVADSVAFYFPIHIDKKNKNFNTKTFRI